MQIITLFAASSLTLMVSAKAATLVNGGLDGNVGISQVPTGWIGIGDIGTPDLFEPGNTAGYFTNAVASSDGGTFVSAVGEYEGIRQIIPGFIVGAQYQLSFEQNSGNHPFYLPFRGHWNVQIGGNSFNSTTIDSDSDWNSESFVFTATAETMTLDLNAVNEPGSSMVQNRGINMGIDGITLTQIPEPSSLFLSAFACGSLLLRRKR